MNFLEVLGLKRKKPDPQPASIPKRLAEVYSAYDVSVVDHTRVVFPPKSTDELEAAILKELQWGAPRTMGIDPLRSFRLFHLMELYEQSVRGADMDNFDPKSAARESTPSTGDRP